MWAGVPLLPLLLLSETLAAASTHRLTALDRAREHSRRPSYDVDDSQPTSDTGSLSSPLTWWWNNVDSFLSHYSPVDSPLTEPGFFNDIRLAFSLSTGPQTTPYKLNNSRILYPRDQQVLRTQCRIVSTLPHQEWDGDIPNYTPTGSNGQPLPTQTIGDGHGGGGSEIIAVTSMCGNIGPGATVTTNISTGPNGQFSWLTCGIDPNDNSTGWEPPLATVDQIITYQGGLRAAVLADGSPYQPCTEFVDLFETAGAEFQIPPLYIAAFALQESGCNPDTTGGGGEQGMMQISPDKCTDAPNGDCKDVVYNVRTAVSYFAQVLRSVNNNTFEAVGNYNGWYRGMNYANATSWGQDGNCCLCQRNLSYLTQFFNGWLQNIDAWNPWLGMIHNTDICSSSG